MKINHGLHGLKGFFYCDLAAKAADSTDIRAIGNEVAKSFGISRICSICEIRG
jgi:hypothetical protein